MTLLAQIKYEKLCFQKTVDFGTFPQLPNFIFVLKAWQKALDLGPNYKQQFVHVSHPGQKNLEQSKDMQQTWTGLENIDNPFFLTNILYLQGKLDTRVYLHQILMLY